MPGWRGSSTFSHSWRSPRAGPRGRDQPERLGCQDREQARRSQESTGRGRRLCVVYAAMFPIYLWKLYDRFCDGCRGSCALGSLLLVGGVLFVALHAVSDVGIYGVLDGKSAYGAHHDPGVSYTLYLMTYALDSVADIFGSLPVSLQGCSCSEGGVAAAGLGGSRSSPRPCSSSGLRPRRSHGVVGLVLDLIGFVLFLFFVLASSVILLRRESTGPRSRSSRVRQLWRAPVCHPVPAYGGS